MIKPWEHESYSDTYYGYSYGQRVPGGYKRTYQTVKDSSKLFLRKGDIVKFGSGYYEHSLRGWPEWFVTERKDKKKFWKRNTVPSYAQNQYAIVVNRYRWIKYKYETYTDYGVIVMMITGPQIGRIRKFYTNRPFQRKSVYPHKKIKLKKPFITITDKLFLRDFDITSFLNRLKEKYEDTEETRNLFLEKICLLLGVNYE